MAGCALSGVIAVVLYPLTAATSGRPAAEPDVVTRRRAALQRLALGQRLPDDARLLHEVGGGIALRRPRALGSADVAERDLVRHQVPDAGQDELPGSHVPRLLLHPGEGSDLRIAVQHLL